MEEYVHHAQGTDPQILQNYIPSHSTSTNAMPLFSNFRELASTEPSAMCTKAWNCLLKLYAEVPMRLSYCATAVNIQWNQVLAFLAGSIFWRQQKLQQKHCLLWRTERHRQNDERPEKSKKNYDEKLDKYLDTFSLRRQCRGKREPWSWWQALNIKNSCCKGQSCFKSIKPSAKKFRRRLCVSEGGLL